MKKAIFSVLFLAITFSCSKPKILRHYKSVSKVKKLTEKDNTDTLLTINAFVLDPTGGSSKTITDLSDKAQGALVEALNSKSKTTNELLSSLAMPIKDSPSSDGIKGSNLWKKRIVLNILKTDMEIGNRLQQILLTFNIEDKLKGKVEFISWDKIATETQTIDLGKTIAGNSTTLSLSPEITMAGVIQGKAPGSFSSTNTFGEEKQNYARFASVNAALVDSTKFQVLRQYLPNEDISGNIVVELTLKSKLVQEKTVYEFIGLYDGTAIVSDPTKIILMKSILVKPDFGTDNPKIPIDLTYKFRYRKIESGNETASEHDDIITYIDVEKTDKAKFILFKKEESDKIMTWEITDGTNYLGISQGTGEDKQLVFDNKSKADILLKWILQTKNLKISDYHFIIGQKVMQAADIKNLKVIISK